MMKIELLIPGCDNLYRFHYVRKWHDENPAYCLTCGKDQSRKCSCYNNSELPTT